jgi:aryl-alcohol dehydrogenase-like predicted oxidoreductase
MTDMTLPQNSLGRTGLSVTKLGYGAMEVRGPRVWAAGRLRMPRRSRF